jgi:cytoskeletal protein CcmA (bactofilin family)
MIPRSHRSRGFALVIILILLAVTFVIALTYASGASVKLASSSNLAKAARARYLAESGIEHATYLLESSPTDILNATQAHPLGPYQADNGDGTYVMYSVATSESGTYEIVASGTTGGVTQKVAANIHRNSPNVSVPRGMMLGGSGNVVLPSSVTIKGDVYLNGSLNNSATIKGKVNATGSISDPSSKITKTKTSGAAQETVAYLTWTNYKSYALNGSSSTAVHKTSNSLNSNDALAKGKAITSSNPGGVVWMTPSSGNTITLGNNLRYKGTIVTDADVVIGKNVKINAVNGFPAIVTSGQILFTDSTSGIIRGVVSADSGVAPQSGDADKSSLKINGALLCKDGTIDTNYEGTLKLNYRAKRCNMVNFGGGNGVAVNITDWND